MSDSTRNGLLTDGQREFLQEGYTVGEGSSTERVTRSRIRNRVQNGILDFALLAEQLDPADQQKAFDNFLGEGAAEHEFNVEGGQAIRALLELLYVGVTEYGDRSEGKALFEELFEAAVERAEFKRENAVKNVEFEVETELVLPWEKLQSEIEHRGVTPRAKRSLEYHLQHNQGEIDVQAAREYLDEYYGIA